MVRTLSTAERLRLFRAASARQRAREKKLEVAASPGGSCFRRTSSMAVTTEVCAR